MQGGVGDCTYEIARALAARGVAAGALTSDKGRQMTNDKGQRIKERDLSLHPSSSVNVLRSIPYWDWSALSQIRRAIAETNADIYHIQYQTAAFGMQPMINFAPRLLRMWPNHSRARRARAIVTFHDLRPMYLFPKAGRVRDWVTLQLARGADAVIATNQPDYDALERHRLAHLALIPIGSNIDPTPPPDFDRAALRARLGIAPGEILLVYFGFLNDSKGGETLIRALAELPNAKLLMLGGQTGASDPTNAAYLAQVRRTIEALGLQARVIWTDFMPQPQVSAHFLAADVCVLPYRDGASFQRGTFMAALAHGMAIVTTTTRNAESSDTPRPASSALPALRDGENVVRVPPDDPRAAADAVRRIAANPELRARLQNGARALAQSFTWDKIADAHLKLYQQLLT